MADPVNITRAPNQGITGLSLSRDGNAIKAVWGNPIDATWETNNARWSVIDETWTFNASKNMSSAVVQSRDGGRHVTGDRIWVRDMGIHTTSTVQYNRNRYHPLTDGRYLLSVRADIWPENPKGRVHTISTFTFQTPRAPTFGDIALDPENGKLSCTIKTDKGEDAHERYDTRWCITRQDSANRSNSYRTEKVIAGWSNTTETEYTAETLAVADVQSVEPGQWVKITFKAFARGVRGNSGTVSKSYVIACPAVASIQRINVSSLSSSGVVTVHIKTNSSTYAPVDQVQLQVLRDTAIDTASAAAESTQWQDVTNAKDDATCSGLSDTVAALPARGNHRWYRLKTTHGNMAPRFSEPVEAVALRRSAYVVTIDALKIASCVPGDDGTSAKLLLGWRNDDTVGTEVSWSENADAWESTEQPNTYDVTWKDATSQVTGYANSASVVIRGLEEGKPYYVKARRYLEDGSDRDWGPYVTPEDSSYPVIPVTRPSDVRLTVPEFVQRGRDIEASWTFESESTQKAWTVYKVVDVGGSASRIVVAAGEDAVGSAVIPVEKMPHDESVDLVVSITTGGEWTDSDTETVRFADPPELSAVTDARLLAQPLQFYAVCTVPDAELVCKVTSRGVSGYAPYGQIEQAAGDCVWSDRLVPPWVLADDGRYYAIVTAPKGLELYDLAAYDLSVQAVDPVTGMSSEPSETGFSVAWLHQAVRPGDDTAITVDPVALTASVTPTKPGNWEDGDVFDLYRLTADGPYLVAEGVQFGATVTDRYAPYGHVDSLAYRVATRTPDGDVDYGDVPYVLRGGSLRLDWGTASYVELPWNVGMRDSYGKDFEEREHLDGSRAGYWNAGRSRDASLSTDMLRLRDWSQADLLREMASHAGPVFVRTSDGCAFQANVDLDGLDSDYESAVMSVSVRATEVQLTDDFRCLPSDIEFPEGEEPGPDDSKPSRSQILRWDGTAPEPGDEFRMNEEPEGEVSVELSCSFDLYMETFPVPATCASGIVTLGEFGSDLEAYIDMASQASGAQFLLKAYYEIAAEGGESS